MVLFLTVFNGKSCLEERLEEACCDDIWINEINDAHDRWCCFVQNEFKYQLKVILIFLTLDVYLILL